RRRPGRIDSLRQHRQPAAGARGRTAKRDGDSTIARREPLQARATGVDGKPVARFGGRGLRSLTRRLVAQAAFEAKAALPSTAGRIADRRGDAALYAGGDGDGRTALRRLPGVAGRAGWF